MPQIYAGLSSASALGGQCSLIIHKREFLLPKLHFCVISPPYFPAILKMVDVVNTQRITSEKTSTTPPLGGVLVTHVRESSSSESRVDEEQLDHNLTIHQFSTVSLGLHTSRASPVEKSFKREDYIYVSFLSLFFLPSGSSK
jgi:hypothetical protein